MDYIFVKMFPSVSKFACFDLGLGLEVYGLDYITLYNYVLRLFLLRLFLKAFIFL